MAEDRLLHIHATAEAVCIACGDAPSAENHFLTDPGQWNREKRVCSPSVRISPLYEVTGREDPRTSAIKEERLPDRKKVRDRR